MPIVITDQQIKAIADRLIEYCAEEYPELDRMSQDQAIKSTENWFLRLISFIEDEPGEADNLFESMDGPFINFITTPECVVLFCHELAADGSIFCEKHRVHEAKELYKKEAATSITSYREQWITVSQQLPETFEKPRYGQETGPGRQIPGTGLVMKTYMTGGDHAMPFVVTVEDDQGNEVNSCGATDMIDANTLAGEFVEEYSQNSQESE